MFCECLGLMSMMSKGRKKWMLCEGLELMSTQVRPRGRKHVSLMTMGGIPQNGIRP
jgi:hypothetical protein